MNKPENNEPARLSILSCFLNISLVTVCLCFTGFAKYVNQYDSTAIVTSILSVFHSAPHISFGSIYYVANRLGVPVGLNLLFLASMGTCALSLCLMAKLYARGRSLTAVSVYGGAILIATFVAGPCYNVIGHIVKNDAAGADSLHPISSFIGSYSHSIFTLLVIAMFLAPILVGFNLI